MRERLKQLFVRKQKGIAGLDLLMSAIVILFIMGFLVMIFVLMAGELSDATNDATAQGVMNNTSSALGEVVTWYSLIITILVMVVLILLTVIIIRAIRGSGLVSGGGA